MKRVFILFFCLTLIFCNFGNICNKAKASQTDFSITIICEGKKYKFNLNESSFNLSTEQKEHYHQPKSLITLKNMGFSEQQCLEYVFPETKQIIERLSKKFNVQSRPERVFVEKNQCSLFFEPSQNGRFVNQNKFYHDVFSCLNKKTKSITIEIEFLKYNEKTINNQFVEKSCFSTNFSNSNTARKNNIRVALECFDGIELDVGEVLSFNQTTGQRNELSGYQKAKIISGGTFVEGFGGGVCQVSTTLYNACLLAGLDVLEVNSHSLPVSYVEPGFDAMVNTGSSDLVVRNNTEGKIIITTSHKNNICKVKIFGQKNKYKITRYSEKIKIIKAEEDIIETDCNKYGIDNMLPGEERRISYAKDGLVSKSYLNYYDGSGTLIKTELIRENIYNPTKGVVVKKEK